jgi:uracil-DNA glycosylase
MASKLFSKIQFIDEECSWKNMTLWKYIQEGNLPRSWSDFFDQEDIQKILRQISDNIVRESKDCIIYPPINRVFRAFTLPLEKVRVIVIGQDPYTCGNAVGLCFSIPPGAKTNPSLQNIYSELENEGYKLKRTGSLLHWANQGCLMLNTGLTVEKGNPESHLKFWYPFAEQLLQYVSDNTKNVAWLLMGKHAAAFKRYTDKNGHKAFITSHPSPLSAYRPFQCYPAFIGSGVFRQVNDFLGAKKIEW